VPGAGRGHDARLLARHGYRVWGFDWAPAAIADATGLAASDGVDVAFEARDVFTLADQYGGFFDGVWEYTCFCAIDPARRAEYTRLVHALLRPGGLLLACFYPLREGTDGPPLPGFTPRDQPSPVRGLPNPIGRSPSAISRAPPRPTLEWLVAAKRL
jgi:hypothetical protein